MQPSPLPLPLAVNNADSSSSGEVQRYAVDPFLRTLIMSWLLAYDSPNTRRAYQRTLTDWASWCEQIGVDPLQVRRVHVDTYARALGELGKSPATIGRTIACLSSFYRYAQADGKVAANPAEAVRRPKQSAHSPTVGLTRNQATQLLAAAQNHSPRSAALIHLLLSNGLRIGEALAADITDLGQHDGHRTLSITRKGGVRALIPLAPPVAHAITTYIGGREHGPIFITGSGKRWDPSSVFRHLRSLAHKAGIETADQISPHSLRHTAITIGLDAEVSLRDMQHFAGHADPRTTTRYDHGRNNLARNPTYTITTQLASGDGGVTNN